LRKLSRVSVLEQYCPKHFPETLEVTENAARDNREGAESEKNPLCLVLRLGAVQYYVGCFAAPLAMQTAECLRKNAKGRRTSSTQPARSRNGFPTDNGRQGARVDQFVKNSLLRIVKNYFGSLFDPTIEIGPGDAVVREADPPDR
jgi:hypothetical protein